MEIHKMKYLLLISSLLLPTVAFSDASCDILSKGNKLYSSKKYKEAINVYKVIEDIDIIGKEPCTDSIYATIATIYKILGNKKIKTNSYKAAMYYKTASKYNRAFAYATLCSNINSCKDSKKHWKIK